jgi:hypothetical protein
MRHTFGRAGCRHLEGGFVRRLATVVALVGTLALVGCSPIAQVPQPSSETASTSTRVPESAPISQNAIDRARELGGVSHRGESLYLVIITSELSESVLASRYDEARPHFGDAADYFVILESRWFPELQTGGLVLAEVHATAESAEEARAWWGGRVDAPWYEAYVTKVTVDTTSPIPVVYADVD